MPAKKIIAALLVVVVAIGGFVAGLILLQERQELREEAAVPDGQAQVSISPETGTYDAGDTIEASVHFNPANIAISGVAVRLLYPFSGDTPEVSVSDITINSALLSTGDWTCPTQNSTQQGGSVVVDIACANTSATGFVADTDTLLANINFQVDRLPQVSPLVVRFDPVLSVVTNKSNNQDILLIPQSTGSYTIGGASPVTETQVTPTTAAGVTTTPAPTAKATATPTTVTPTATDGGQLPDAGISYPTVLGLGLGVLVVLGALVLAL
jgi:hypothetical protein